jgi:hypothetical protein
MERRCRACGERTADFATFRDESGALFGESTCRACKRVQPKAARAARAPKAPRAAPSAPSAAKVNGKLLTAAKAALAEYELEDVANPVALIASPCHFTGVGPAMCLDLLDRRGRAVDGNVVACGYYVRAARGGMRAVDFQELCREVSAGTALTPARAKEAMAMSQRYDKAGGSMFGRMCDAVAARHHEPA